MAKPEVGFSLELATAVAAADATWQPPSGKKVKYAQNAMPMHRVRQLSALASTDLDPASNGVAPGTLRSKPAIG